MQCYQNTAIIHSRALQKSACFIFPVKLYLKREYDLHVFFYLCSEWKVKTNGLLIFFLKFIGKPPPTIFLCMILIKMLVGAHY